VPKKPDGAATRSAPPEQPRARTGLDGLDEVLGGGLPRNHIYLLDGEPGTGKTTLAIQYLLEGAREAVKEKTRLRRLVGQPVPHHFRCRPRTGPTRRCRDRSSPTV